MRCLSCRTTTLRIFLEGIVGLSLPQTISARPFTAKSSRTVHPLSATSRAHLYVGSTLARTRTRWYHEKLAGKAETCVPSQVKPGPSKSSARSFNTQVGTQGKAKPPGALSIDNEKGLKLQALVKANSSNRKGRTEKAASEKNNSSKLPHEEKQRKAKREPWQIQKEALETKFGEEGWKPRKRLSPDTIEGIRAMHRQYPNHFTTPVLAEQFQVSPEVIRRILKSKWTPSPEEMEKRRERWDRRGEKIWTKLAEVGVRPPKKWREMGIGRAKPGEPPKWKRKEYWKAKHPENIYTKAKDVETIIATRPDSASNVQRESFADRIL